MLTPWTKERVLQLIDSSLASGKLEIVGKLNYRLYERQTADEQNSMTTSHKNHQGYNGRDAEFLSAMAVKFKSGFWTVNMATKTGKIIKKYANQLANIGNELQGTVS